ncbi:dihydroxyacetone kinase phosphoryl donor subunit DhaM [Streptomyces varsoviensis]
MLITALYEATDTGLPEVFEGAEGEEEATSEGKTAAAPATQSPQPAAGEKAGQKKEPKENGRVGVVLVSHSRDVAASTADLAKALVGTGDPAPVAAAGGLPDGGIGTSAELIRRAIADVDEGKGVVVLCDMGSAVLTVKEILADPAGNGVPEDLRIADAPFVEGAVAALVTASVGGDADMVIAATDDARGYRKV